MALHTKETKDTQKKLHVQYSNPVDEVLKYKWLQAVPQAALKKILTKMNAPKSRPLDVYEVFQEDPNEIIEVEKNKVWMITYKYGGGDPKDSRAMGLGPEQKNYDKIMEAAKCFGEETVNQAEKDWNALKDYFAIDVKEGIKGAYCKAVKQMLIMAVVKLKSGDILLYSPIQIHEGTILDNWLKDLGPVKYVIIGSCYHTLHLKSTLKRYPDAICIGTTTSEQKLNAVDALLKQKLDYNFLVESDVMAANDILAPEGVTLKFTKGDMFSQSIFCVAHETGLEVDLLYRHHDKCTCDYCREKGIFEGRNSSPENVLLRLFTLRLLSKPNSPNGYLPPYRFSAMDPTSIMSKMSWPRPANDGSSCKEMAKSMRNILKMDYKNVISVHWGLLPANDFKMSINEDWKWLDESNLLQE